MTCLKHCFRVCLDLKYGLWLLRGCFHCFKTVYGRFYGLFVAGFVSRFVIVCGK